MCDREMAFAPGRLATLNVTAGCSSAWLETAFAMPAAERTHIESAPRRRLTISATSRK